MPRSDDIPPEPSSPVSADILKLDSLTIQKVSAEHVKPRTVPVCDISFKAIPYTCDILRNHCRWCDCTSPRLHTYLATQHRCDSYCITSGEATKRGLSNDSNWLKSDCDMTDLFNHNSSNCSEDLIISETEDIFEDIEEVLLGDDTFLNKPPLHSSNEKSKPQPSMSKALPKPGSSKLKKKGKRNNKKPKDNTVCRKIPADYHEIIARQPVVSLVALSPSLYRKHCAKTSGVFEELTLKQEPPSPHAEDISIADFRQELATTVVESSHEQPITRNQVLENQPNYSFAALLTEEAIKSEPPDDFVPGSPQRLYIDEEANSCDANSIRKEIPSHPETVNPSDEGTEAAVSFINPIKIKINLKSLKDTKKGENKQKESDNKEENVDGLSILNSFSLARSPKKSHSNRFFQSIPESLVCAACNVTFDKFSDLVVHLINHQKEGIILCYYCQKSFGDKTGMKRHMRVHTGEKPYECRVCGKKFSLPGNFKKHRDIHENVRSEPCPICKRTFRRKEHLKHHMMTHTGEKPFKCTRCDSSFAARYSLQIHMNIHLNHRPYVCSYCDKKFADKSTMRKHIRIHTGEKPFECEVCSKRFGESGTLASHMLTHKNDRPFECTRCDLSFKSTGGLKQHSKVHEDSKRFECTVCKTKFRLKYNMKMHERIHTGEKPFTCSQCPLAFRSRSCLSKHALCHAAVTERKFPCTYCKKRFYRKSHLKRHLDMHLGIKSFNCEKCGKGFSSSNTLKRHVKTFHTKGARNFPCYVCGKVFKRKIYVTNHICKGIKEELKTEPNETISEETSHEVIEELLRTEETTGAIKEEPQ